MSIFSLTESEDEDRLSYMLDAQDAASSVRVLGERHVMAALGVAEYDDSDLDPDRNADPEDFDHLDRVLETNDYLARGYRPVPRMPEWSGRAGYMRPGRRREDAGIEGVSPKLRKALFKLGIAAPPDKKYLEPNDNTPRWFQLSRDVPPGTPRGAQTVFAFMLALVKQIGQYLPEGFHLYVWDESIAGWCLARASRGSVVGVAGRGRRMRR